jgi:lipoprotein-anchoring transpeptidase ErfK/SrfK
MNKYYAGTRNTRFTALGLLACALLLTFLAAPLAFASNAAPGPTPPTGIEVFNRQEDLGLRVTLTWNTRPECFAYQVYRATDVNGPYACVGGVSGSTMNDFPFFLDDTIKPGQTYYYRVTALDSQWHEGAQSVVITAKPPAVRRIAGVGKSIVCSIADQRVYFLENDVVVNILRCSTGAGGTPTGSYHIMDHRGTVSGCNYWMDWLPNYGMHAWPSYLGEYEENLGVTPRSHGCIRLHPLEASWAYNWTPDGTPLTVTGASCGRLPIQGMSIINGATAPSKTWYFAEGYTGGQFEEYLSLFNPGASQVDAKTTYYPEGNAPVTETYTVPAHSRSTISVNVVSGLPPVGHSTIIEATGDIVAQRAEYFDYQGKRGGDCTLGASEPSKTWFFAEGYAAAGFATYLLLFNPNDATIGLDATYTPEGGASMPVHYFMAPHSRGTILVNAVPGCNGKSVAFRVDSELPIVAERATYFTMGLPVNGVNGGDCVMGATAPSKTWYLAEGCTAGFFDEYLLVFNPNPETATVNCVFYPDTGPYGYSFQVPPGARGTISVDSIPGLASANTPVKVESDRDIVIEQSMYCTRDSRRGGDAALGLANPSKDWYFSEGYTGGSFDEYLLLFNPSDEAMQVNLVFHPEGGQDVGWAVGLPPRTRITLHVDDVPGVQWVGSAVELHSEKPFVVQESEYYCKPR